MIQAYYMPKTVKEAAELLCRHEGKARIMAGGTDLVLDIREGRHQPEYLVDITKINDLQQIEQRENCILIGAGVTHNQAAASPVIKEYARTLAVASSMVGSRQIRNLSTLAGNVVNAQPAADSAVALIAMGADAEIRTGESSEVIPVEALYEGFGKSRIDSCGSLLTGFRIPLETGAGSSYVRLQQRKALALPMLCVAVWIKPNGNMVENVRIVVAPVGVGPVRARAAEQAIRTHTGTNELWKEAAVLVAEDANPRDSQVRGSRQYRLEVLPSLVEEALRMAWENAFRKEEAHE